jgi:thiol-disulfide isomerase/thioredoxin
MIGRRLAVAVAVAGMAYGACRAATAQPPSVKSIDRQGYAGMLAGLKGRPVVVNMWATWCVPCREEFPDLVKLHREMGARGVQVVAISLDLSSALESDVVPFLEAQGATFPVYIKSPGDDDGFINAVSPAWSGALPSTFVYDASGKLVEEITGPTTFDALGGIVTPLLPVEKPRD